MARDGSPAGGYHRRMSRILRLALAAGLLLGAAGCKSPPGGDDGRKVLHFPLRAKVGTLDPVRCSSQYRGIVGSSIFDTLMEFQYPARPFALKPNLLTQMPEVSADGLVYSFELRDDVLFHDDASFTETGGKGRRLVTDDVFYSLKRMCDPYWSPEGYWLFQGRVKGLDEYKAAESARKQLFVDEERGADFEWDYELAVAGLRKIDDQRFEIELVEPFPQFLYILTMTYTAVVPREAVEFHDLEFGQHPVGSGPFRLAEFWRGSWVRLVRNETYREERVPPVAELSPEQLAVGLDRVAGRKLPLVDEILMGIYEQDQPMWLKFRAGDLDIIQVPAEPWPTIFEKDGTLKTAAHDTGIRNFNLPLLDLIYWGFNMEDPVWGKPEKAKLLRQAVSYAVDLEMRNAVFYNGKNTLYLGPVPPGLDAYEPGYRKRDTAKARALLAEAGHPNGEGLPPLKYEASKGGNTSEQAEMFTRQLAEIGIRVETNFNTFPELSDKMNKKKAQFFGLAWGADYPDAENFLQLFYGPNESPGSNSFNYKNPEFDRLFNQAKTMQPGPERTVLYQRLRAMIIEDQPMIGSMARTRFWVWNERVQHFKPEEVYYSWFKYLDVATGDEQTPAPAVARN